MLTPRSHRALDHVIVAVLVVAPFALRFGGPAEVAAYVLAGAWFGLTLVTRFPVQTAARRPLPFTVHGHVEAVVGLALLIVPWLVPDVGLTARIFAAVLGALTLVVWKLTPYEAGDRAARSEPPAGAEPPEPPPPPRP